jgi:hypothetical protein
LRFSSLPLIFNAGEREKKQSILFLKKQSKTKQKTPNKKNQFH